MSAKYFIEAPNKKALGYTLTNTPIDTMRALMKLSKEDYSNSEVKEAWSEEKKKGYKLQQWKGLFD